MSVRPWVVSCLALTSSAALGCPADDAATGSEGSSSSEGSSEGPSTTLTTADSSSDTSASTIDETSVGPADSSSSSTGVPDNCGDGHLDDDEACDDGNTDEGDTCHADCTLSFEIAWTSLHDGDASDDDYASRVYIDGEGNIVVLGYQGIAGQGADVWLQQYLPDGSEGWSYGYDGADGDDDYGSAMVVTADGDFLIAGNTTVTGSDQDILVLRVDGATHMLEWDVVVDGPGTIVANAGDADFAEAIAVTADGGVVVAGTVAVDDQGWDQWVGSYDDAGVELWTATHDGTAHGDDIARAVVMGDDGDVLVFGNDDQSSARGNGTLLVFDAEGIALDAETQSFDIFVEAAAPAGDGNLVVCGDGDFANTQSDVIVRKYDPDFTELWTATFDGSMDSDYCSGVHVDGGGNIYAVGITYRIGEQANAFVQAYDQDGGPLWGDDYNTEGANLGESWAGVATDAMGDVVVSGYATVLGHDADAFVRKYHPL